MMIVKYFCGGGEKIDFHTEKEESGSAIGGGEREGVDDSRLR